MISVGLPNYSSPFAWFAMESLCRQETFHEWELLIYEDSDNPLGALFYSGYIDRLKKVGCINVKYEYSKERVALSLKWIWMGKNMHKGSLGLMLQASDCYSGPHRIETAVNGLALGYDWIQTNIGYFYNVLTCKVMLYNSNEGTGLNMTISKRQLLSMPIEEKWSGVDYWLFTNMTNSKVMINESDNWKNGIDTDGFNRISLHRKQNYNNPEPPFFATDVTIKEIIPEEIIHLLNDCKYI